ncbi:MAG TPA: NUDIX domain-containing protein [Chloroflexia bacterium]|nr:NUDIX domain-containing protein [Chloroflexia bacterium]
MADLKYCPMCASELVEEMKFGEMRQCCPNPECGFIFFLDPKLVAVVLVENEDRLLLGRRNHNPGKGLWSFPSGYVNRGEKVEEAAIREVKEETNLDVRLKGLLGVYSENGSPVVLTVYRAEMSNQRQELLPQEEEVMELAFFALNDLPELAFPFDHSILADFKNLKLRD